LRTDVALFGIFAQTNATTKVRILERPSTEVLIVAWREAGGCCYCEQSWERTIASGAGVSALTGEPIAPGQAVFGPVGNPAPLNRKVRIVRVAWQRLQSLRAHWLNSPPS